MEIVREKIKNRDIQVRIRIHHLSSYKLYQNLGIIIHQDKTLMKFLVKSERESESKQLLSIVWFKNVQTLSKFKEFLI